MKAKIIKGIVHVLICAVALAYYNWLLISKTRAECKAEIVLQEKEVIRYVEKKKADIQSKPNATRDELIVLMHNNKL